MRYPLLVYHRHEDHMENGNQIKKGTRRCSRKIGTRKMCGVLLTRFGRGGEEDRHGSLGRTSKV